MWGWRSGNEGLLSWEPLLAKSPEKPWEGDPKEATQAAKRFAIDIGAVDAGVTHLDPRWVYSNWYHRGTKTSGRIEIREDADKPMVEEDGTKVIPVSMKYIIVMLVPMPYEMVNTAPAYPANGATGLGYSRMAFTAATMAEFFRFLGYNAIPMCNDTMLNVPLCIQAGLGELGRNGLLVSAKMGPRVRSCKVLTDLPLAEDKPINLGVRNFCESCKKCARECPAGAISDGPQTMEARNISNNPGVKKWPVDNEKCRIFWYENSDSCIRCIATCPYNKPEGYWTHAMGNRVAPILGGTLVSIDDWMGYGKILPTRDYWKKPVD